MTLFTPAKGAQKSVVPVSPKKAVKKRVRKTTEKAAGEEWEGDEEEGKAEPKKPHSGTMVVKKKKSKGTRKAKVAWAGDEYPKITKVTKCEDGLDGFQIEVLAKKQGKGHWQETLFSLDTAQLSSIDNLSSKTKKIVQETFRKAVAQEYGQKWPNPLRLALAGSEWAKDIIPAAVAAESDAFVGLEDLSVGMAE